MGDTVSETIVRTNSWRGVYAALYRSGSAEIEWIVELNKWGPNIHRFKWTVLHSRSGVDALFYITSFDTVVE